MTDSELDLVYTSLCNTLTAEGEAQAMLYLARLAMLAIVEVGDARCALGLIDAAKVGG